VSGPGFTFDTGALIALERGDYRMRTVLKLARADSVRVVVPTVVLGEWWRGRTKARELLVASVQLEPLSESLAKLAGEALAKVRKATFVDAVVMASAAQRETSSILRIRATSIASCRTSEPCNGFFQLPEAFGMVAGSSPAPNRRGARETPTPRLKQKSSNRSWSFSKCLPVGSGSRTRTCDHSVNSRTLYRLSYPGKGTRK
jgi:predicted nucleic acid-binding protein